MELEEPPVLTRHQRYNQKVVGRRRALIIEMGGVCNYCGETDISKLEFNHLKPRNWRARHTSPATRIKRHQEEWQRTLDNPEDPELNLACGTCNKKLGEPGESTDPDPEFFVEDDF